MKNLKKILGLIVIFSLFIVNLVTFKLVKAQPNNSTMEKIEKLGNSLVKAEGIKPMAWERSMAKKQLWTAIQSLSPKDTEHYMSQYYVLFK